MINMLSPADKRELLASRTNTLLLRYAILLGALIILVIAEIGAVYAILSVSKQNNQTIIANNEQKILEQSATQQRADAFRNDLATAKIIMERQVHYTSIIKTISDLIPSGVVMDTITIDPATFGAPTQITIHAKSYGDAIKFRSNLSNSDKFSNVSFRDITYSPSSTDAYGFTSTFNVTFKKELLNS